MYNFIVIGTGNVGYTLSNAFKSLKYRCIAYVEPDDDNAQYFQKYFTEAHRLNYEMPFPKSDFIMLSVKDDDLEAVTSRLANKKLSTKHIFHTSGFLSSEIFQKIKETNIERHTIHPLVSIPVKTDSLSIFQDIFFAVEGDNPKWCEQLLAHYPKGILNLTSEQKKLYHTTAVISGNLILAVLNAGKKIFSKSGIHNEEYETIFSPLLTSVLNNLKEKSVENSLSGPMQRGDSKLITEHIELIKSAGLVNEAKLYEFLVDYLKNKNY